MAARKLKNPIKIPKAKADDKPATRRMLKIVRNDLREEIKGTKIELKGQINKVKAEIKEEISGVKTEIKAVHIALSDRITKVEIGLSEVKQLVHQTNLLVEEQNANNRIVLESLQGLWQRQERIENPDNPHKIGSTESSKN